MQRTDGQFDYCVVVADNDANESAKPVVAALRHRFRREIIYCVEPEQNIASARNKGLAHAKGKYIALIDDDELPQSDWLFHLVRACEASSAAGVLGPVRPRFDSRPPDWLARSRLCERQEYPTGTVLKWNQTRTGNALVKRSIIEGEDAPFRPEFGNGGEDQDFFRRMMHRGHRFVWCNEAVVHEVVPPERWRRRYLFKRALLRGQNERTLLTVPSVLRSMGAVIVYSAALPVLAILGHHLFMRYSVRLLDHVGKLAAACSIKLVRGKYLNG